MNMYMCIPVFPIRLFPRQSFSIVRGEIKSVICSAPFCPSQPILQIAVPITPSPKINTRARW
ncbi:hypothetical protein I7I48_09648 [Histoplasma ohiense]|nr:hypothetical protein I7I48_09648 [Histoplasma ohiense (nom. inval.)]